MIYYREHKGGLNFWTWTLDKRKYRAMSFAIKGKPQRVSASVSQLIFSPLRAHSQKPDEVRDRIVALLGDLPRIELFARSAFDGWDCWGNEAPINININKKNRD